jgi:hypothetical protein
MKDRDHDDWNKKNTYINMVVIRNVPNIRSQKILKKNNGKDTLENAMQNKARKSCITQTK